MNNLKAKFQNIDWKQLGIDHGEKFVSGLIGLLVLLAIVFAPYSAYDKAPSDFETKVQAGDQALAASKWPAETEQQFDQGLENNRDAITDLFQPLDLNQFAYPAVSMFEPLYKIKSKVDEIEWLAPEEVIATPGVVIAHYKPEDEEEDLLLAGDPESGFGTPCDTGFELDEMDTFEPLPGFLPGVSNIDRRRPPQPGEPGYVENFCCCAGMMCYGMECMCCYCCMEMCYSMCMGMMCYMGEYGEMDTGPKVNGKGHRFMAVRAVIPWKRQLERVAKAFSLSNQSSAEEHIEYLDFELQRQAAIGGANPWAGPWETVDIQPALDVLDAVEDFDFDIIDPGYTHEVFTMPLPLRVAGIWTDDLVGHPRIKSLTDEQIAIQNEISAKAMELYEKKPEATRATKKGFSSRQASIRNIRQNVYGTPESEQLFQDLNEEFQQKNEEYNAGVSGLMRMATSAMSTRALLFRYLDFSVEPGNAYRYRVRLVVRNPNYARPIEELVDPAFAEGETRETAWSKPSEVTVMRNDVQYFLTGAAPATRFNAENTSLEVFQWYSDSGTLVASELRGIQAGQVISAMQKTEVLRPEATFETEDDVPFDAGDVLLDIRRSPKLTTDDFPDLELPRGGLAFVDQALAVSPSGEFVALDTISRTNTRRMIRQQFAAQNQPWMDLKDRGRPQAPLGMEMGMCYGMGSMGGLPTRNRSARSRRGRTRNPIRQ